VSSINGLYDCYETKKSDTNFADAISDDIENNHSPGRFNKWDLTMIKWTKKTVNEKRKTVKSNSKDDNSYHALGTEPI
jgi:hypothetical protein